MLEVEVPNRPIQDNRVYQDTAFVSLLFDKIKPLSNQDKADSYCSCLEIPWQAWLYGRGGEREPKIIKVHLAQVGISTLLVELLVKLETIPNIILQKVPQDGYALMPKEEIVLSVKGASIQEVLGLAVRRAFYNCYCDPTGKGLVLENLKKSTMVYVDGSMGGERLLAASHIFSENNKIKYKPLPDFQPFYYQFHKQSTQLLQVDTEMVLCKSEFLWTVDFTVKKPPTAPPEPILSRELPQAGAFSGTILRTRPKPGEKWQKKDGKCCSTPCKNKSVLCIRP
jgi:hypothetical protein